MGATTEEPKSNGRRAREIVGWYTLAATGTGALPIPATSVAVVANNGLMLAHVGAVMGTVVTWEGVVCSLGIAGTLNVAGRTVFIEAGKALGWGTGNVWALAALSAVGATTAGLQTYILGLIAIEMALNGGQPIDSTQAARVIAIGKETLKDFISEMKDSDLSDPGIPSAEVQAIVESRRMPALGGNESFGPDRALALLEDAGTSIRGATLNAVEAIGSGASRAGSAVKGLAGEAASAVGSMLQGRIADKPSVFDVELDQGLEKPRSVNE